MLLGKRIFRGRLFDGDFSADAREQQEKAKWWDVIITDMYDSY